MAPSRRAAAMTWRGRCLVLISTSSGARTAVETTSRQSAVHRGVGNQYNAGVVREHLPSRLERRWSDRSNNDRGRRNHGNFVCFRWSHHICWIYRHAPTRQLFELQRNRSAAHGLDSLDLKGINPATVQSPTYSGNSTGGTLTVADGIHTVNVALLGNYLASTFVASSDGQGGTSIVDPYKASK